LVVRSSMPAKGRQAPKARETNETKWRRSEVPLPHLSTRLNCNPGVAEIQVRSADVRAPHFEEARLDELHRIIGQYPLEALVIKGPNGVDANHVPFELDGAAGERGVLRAHVARANPANPVWTEM